MKDTKPRAQLSHVLLDVDFFHKPTIKALRRKYGLSALVAYQEILCQVSRATNAEIEADTALASAEEFDVSEPEAFLEYCLTHGLLHKTQDDKITQERVIEDQERLAKSRDDYRKRQEKSRVSRVTEGEITRDTTQKKHFSVNTEDLNTEDLNLEEGVQGGKPLDPHAWIDRCVVLSTFDEARMRRALRAWAKHCEAAFPRINFNEIQAEALQSVGQNYGERFFEAVKLSIKNGWRTVCFEALPAPNSATKKLSATEQTVESARRILGAI